jgi:hypothetical protein
MFNITVHHWKGSDNIPARVYNENKEPECYLFLKITLIQIKYYNNIIEFCMDETDKGI